MNRNYWIQKSIVVLSTSAMTVLGVTATAQGEANFNSPDKINNEQILLDSVGSETFGDITYFLEVNYPNLVIGSKWNAVTQNGTIYIVPGAEQEVREAIAVFPMTPEIVIGKAGFLSYRQLDKLLVEILLAVNNMNLAMPLEASYDPETNTVLLGVYFNGPANEDDLYLAVHNSFRSVFKRVTIVIESLDEGRIGQVAAAVS